MIILGINAYHANSSAAIVVDGRLIAAVEEERLNRVKYAAGLPVRAIQFCLDAAGAKLQEVDYIAIPRDPRARILTKLRFAMRMPRFALERIQVMRKFSSVQDEIAAAFDLAPESIRAQYHRVEHHTAHMASACFSSPFETSAVLSMDGLGDFASAMYGVSEGPNLRAIGEVTFPHSLGLYYSALTQYLGFWKFGDEYKVMGLAAYGQPEFLEEFRNIVRADGPLGFRLGLKYFIHQSQGPEMSWRDANSTPVMGRLFSDYLEERLGPARKNNDEPLTQRHHNLAASMQAALEEVLAANWAGLAAKTGQKSLCLAGGVAFNCLANGKIFERSPFERVFVQPAAGDAGLSVGAAFALYHGVLGKPRNFTMEHAYWGPQFTAPQMRSALAESCLANGDAQVDELREDPLLQATARHIAAGKIVGWYQGATEWGPRALGNRSILADPRRPEMKDILNRRIKHREIFRPFAPSIIEEATGEFFEQTHPSPFMTFAYPVRPEKRAQIPAPTHVDGTARLQTVSRTANPLYWRLLRAVGDLTGVPAVLNTSFNDNEPIVCRPEEAIDCFRRTQMDVLAIGNFLLEKKSAAAAGGAE